MKFKNIKQIAILFLLSQVFSMVGIIQKIEEEPYLGYARGNQGCIYDSSTETYAWFTLKGKKINYVDFTFSDDLKEQARLKDKFDAFAHEYAQQPVLMQ